MTVYKQCPYCDVVFEIGPEDGAHLRRHLRVTHAEESASTRGDPGQSARSPRA